MKLTDAQIKAIETDARECLVIAGAGSGKTATLVRRIARIIESGVDSNRIIAFTFTRKAAREMHNRLCDLLGRTPDIFMGTFHSLALRILQVYGNEIGYDPKTLSVIDSDDADMLLKQVAVDLGFFKSGKWRYGLSEKKILRWREDLYCGRESEFDDASQKDHCKAILREYQSCLFNWNLVDFGQILLQCRRLFKEKPDILAKYHERFSHVFVDEMQDTDAVQFDLHDFLSPPANLFAVGDLRQSIYGFRGSRPELIAERHGKAESIDLLECFRCGDSIVNAANRLIGGKPLVGKTGRTGSVCLMPGRSSDVIGAVADERRKGYEWRDIAILARTHRTLTRLEFICNERGVPCHRVGSRFDVCQTEAFRDSLALLRLIANHRDDRAFLRTATRSGITQAEIAAWRADAVSNNKSVCDAAVFNDTHGPFWPVIRESTGETSIADVITRLEPLLSAPDVWNFWKTHCENMTVAKAVAWYGLFNAKRDAQEDLSESNCVQLLTVHAAKGLEWPCVFVVNMNEGDFPSSMSLRENAIEEERRVAYVAVTRAKEKLVLHYRRVEDQSEEGKIKQPSRFLAEMGLTIRSAVLA